MESVSFVGLGGRGALVTQFRQKSLMLSPNRRLMSGHLPSLPARAYFSQVVVRRSVRFVSVVCPILQRWNHQRGYRRIVYVAYRQSCACSWLWISPYWRWKWIHHQYPSLSTDLLYISSGHRPEDWFLGFVSRYFMKESYRKFSCLFRCHSRTGFSKTV